jgi:hypothetical protein
MNFSDVVAKPEAKLSAKKRDVLRAKLRLIEQQRDQCIFDQTQQFDREDAANRVYGNSAAFDRAWRWARDRADQAATETIDACIAVGVRDDHEIAKYAACGYEKWATEFLADQLPKRGQHASNADRLLRDMMVSQAGTHQATFFDRVLSRRHDEESREGTMVQRLLNRLSNRPGVAWLVVVWVVLSSLYTVVQWLNDAFMLMRSMRLLGE